jgi:hypothetical protein
MATAAPSRSKARIHLVVVGVWVAAVEDTDAFHCEELEEGRRNVSRVLQCKGQETYIVSSIRMVVYTTEESGRSILADELDEEMFTSGMFGEEVGYVVDET